MSNLPRPVLFTAWALLGAAIYVAGLMNGLAEMETAFRTEAVKHGAARFVATDDGKTEFHWNDELKETK